jgi:hypothetical protein
VGFKTWISPIFCLQKGIEYPQSVLSKTILPTSGNDFGPSLEKSGTINQKPSGRVIQMTFLIKLVG